MQRDPEIDAIAADLKRHATLINLERDAAELASLIEDTPIPALSSDPRTLANQLGGLLALEQRRAQMLVRSVKRLLAAE